MDGFPISKAHDDAQWRSRLGSLAVSLCQLRAAEVRHGVGRGGRGVLGMVVVKGCLFFRINLRKPNKNHFQGKSCPDL